MKALTCSARGYCCWWEMILSGNMSFMKRNFGWLDIWELNPELLGSLWLRENHFGWRRAMPLWNYTLAFALQLRKSTENLAQGSQVVGLHITPTWPSFLQTASAGLLSISSPRSPVSDVSQPLVGTSDSQVAELRGSSHQLTLSQSTQSVLWCRQRMESPNTREFACY
jgi:hypothetical protein